MKTENTELLNQSESGNKVKTDVNHSVLSLEHLAPYLPYELNVQIKGMTGILTTRNLDYYSIENIKPILRPLSDLSKQIINHGNVFIPIERLLDIESSSNWSISDYLISECGKNEWWTRLKENKSFVFGFNNNGFYMLNQFNENKTIGNQIKLWQKLLEWNFDIYGLIEKGLAKSIHDVE